MDSGSQARGENAKRRGHVRLDPGGGQGRAGTNRQVVEGKKLLALVKQVIASRSKRASSTSSCSLIAQLKCVQHQKWLQSKTDKKQHEEVVTGGEYAG